MDSWGMTLAEILKANSIKFLKCKQKQHSSNSILLIRDSENTHRD